MTNPITGTLGITRDVFDRWRNPSHFYKDIEECCEILGIRTGLTFKLSREAVDVMHSSWQDEYKVWLDELLPPETDDLSHIKKAALLIYWFCQYQPITISGDGHNTKPKSKHSNIQDGDEAPSLPNTLWGEDVQKIKEGGCSFVIWLIAYAVCEFLEMERKDREDPFVTRITDDFEKDMVSGLHSGQISAQALHLILKALFLRD